MKKEKSPLLMITALICILSLVVMTAVLIFFHEKTESISFTPPPFDTNAVQGTPDVPENLGWGEVDTQVYKASVCGVVIPDEDTADIWFTNPESNSVWLKLRVLDGKGNTIGETGIIRPGEYVQKVTFKDVPEVGDTIVLKLMAYEPETYYSAGSASLTITVAGGTT